MPDQVPPSHDSRAEKRVLWEVRQRYNVSERRTPARRPAPASTPPAPPRRPSNSSPGRAGRSSKPTGHLSRSKKRHWGWRVFGLFIVILLVSGGIFGYRVIVTGNKISTSQKSIFGQLSDLLFSGNQTLRGEKEDRINILLMAIGGEGHSGENLADTIMLASIRPSDNTIALLSIPRDLYVQVPNEQFFTKINAVHAYGESKKKDGGPDLLKEKVAEITGSPIHYYARVDFTAFKNLVDTVGGVDITVENEFFDYWHKITFPAGTEKMNGERALAYARARYVEGPEGGDFKRANRQQQLLLAIRDKVFSVNTAFDFGRVNGILNSLSNNIRTDMQLWEMRRFYELARQIDHTKVRSVVLTTGGSGVLVGSTEVLGGTPASVLRPRTGDFSEIQQIVRNIFDDNKFTHLLAPSPQNSETPPVETDTTPTPSESPEIKASVEIRNGTNVTGLAKKTQDKLEEEGYEILAIGNAVNRSTAKTTTYTINTKRQESTQTIADFLGSAAANGLPEGETTSKADVLIILGQDAAE